MNVLIVSQCNKNALKETRRILDQFAERKGERTWQTAITWEGLETLRRLLRKTARRNTAVACHWVRGRDHTELMWIVGNAEEFNDQGVVPTNTTSCNVLRSGDENDWHSLEEIRGLAAMAALFHDLGKANKTFQKKLKGAMPLADPLRHEWVSLRLFEAFVGEAEDREWLKRLANLPDEPDLKWMGNILRDEAETSLLSPFNKLKPVAQAVGWLIVSHHRLPRQGGEIEPNPRTLTRLPVGICEDWCGSRVSLKGLEGRELKERKRATKECWEFEHQVPFSSATWRARVRKQANRMLACLRIFEENWLTENTYVLHMARLALMLADHHYSSLTDPAQREKGDEDYPLFANTRRDTRAFNQSLDEHIVGVERHTARILYALPKMANQLPRLARHRGFSKRSADKRFQWQDRASEVASSLREISFEHGFFGVNMASTGRGKTLANGRIMYALADPQKGARFSIALGLRTLTLQTGDAYRQRLGLGQDDLAVLVGGRGVRELYEHHQEMRHEESWSTHEQSGSESAESMLQDDSYLLYDGGMESGPLAAWLGNSRGASVLVDVPILICTIDHLIPATESLRGGAQIAPMLRLITSDIVLDEPDDFDINDLPALTRLVHWAGLLGSRMLLSSATLPPSIVEGLFTAYVEGRKIFQKNRGIEGMPLEVCTAWFDEFGAEVGRHFEPATMIQQHCAWVEKRVERLRENGDVRRRGQIVPLARETAGTEDEQIADALRGFAHTLHSQHHTVDPDSGKRISFGLIRLANIGPLIAVTRAFAALPTLDDCRFHLCCYHSQHPLLVRSNIERRLDRCLNRQQPHKVLADPELGAILRRTHEPHHLFIVLATPVAEVGRDHDYDWAIVEPSSMRSIIQLAGRVRRHRCGKIETPNVYLLETNIRSKRSRVGEPTFSMPGFEDAPEFLLKSHSLTDLLSVDQWETIDAIPRIQERAGVGPSDSLAALEHDHLRAVMVGDGDSRGRKLDVANWWNTYAHLSGELQRKQRFRNDPQGRVAYGLLIDDEDDEAQFTRFEYDGKRTAVSNLLHPLPFECAKGVEVWGVMDYLRQVEQLAEEMGISTSECALRFGALELPEKGCDQGWDYHPALGFSRHQ